MTLAPGLFDVHMEFQCPECGTPKHGTGEYFKSLTRYRCPGCKQSVPVTYDTKLKLFALAEKRLNARGAIRRDEDSVARKHAGALRRVSA